jgi:exopolyphosphatase/guanosine-5'-triphosphate,3'-diphosphate pyrophosphatase
VAVIDIGSNSVRLVVFDGAKRSPTPFFNEKVLCGLGRELASTGRLGDDAIASALRVLRRYRAIVDQLGAQSLHAVATAAAREAKNGADFIKAAQDICQTKIQVLSGREEAALSGNGVIAGMPKANGLAADMGGGSLEVLEVKDGSVHGGVTLPLGGLRLIDLSDGDVADAGAFVDEQLASVDWFETGRDRPIYMVGGTWRAFGRLHMAQTRYPLGVMHGYSMSVDEALKFAHLLDHLSPSSLDGIGEISKMRRETLPFGALVLERFIRRVRPSEIIVSAFGLREGLVYGLLSKDDKARDPLLAACGELADLRARSPRHARELCDWTDVIFALPALEETREERRLRHAACLLSDIGWRAHPEYRGEHSLDLIAHASFAGIDHPGRAFLALSVFFRHQGIEADTQASRLAALADARSIKRAKILGAAIRAAHMISAAMPDIIGDTPVKYENGAIVLRIPKRHRALEGERLERRFAVLAKELGTTLDIRIGGRA